MSNLDNRYLSKGLLKDDSPPSMPMTLDFSKVLNPKP